LNIRSVILCFLVVFCPVQAADIYWTNSTTGNFTNQTKWMTTVVPTAGDNMLFTNNDDLTIDFHVDATNANVYLNTFTGNDGSDLQNFNIGTNTWWITNSFLMGNTVGGTADVTIASGTLVVTNSTRTGSIVLGSDVGNGLFAVGGGTVHVDHLYDTNGGTLSLDKGVLITYGNSEMSNSGVLTVGGAVGSITFDMRQTNLFTGTGDIRIGNASGATGIVLLTSSSALWTNSNGKDVLLGQSSAAPGNQIIITNGGRFYSSGTLSIGTGSSSNVVLVAGSGSEIRVASLLVGNTRFDNQLLISNQGVVVAGGSSLVVGDGGTNALVTVTDSGSQFIYTGGDFRLGDGGYGSMMIVSNGGYFRSQGDVLLGNSSASDNNVLTVTGAGTIWTNTGDLDIGIAGSGNSFTISAGAFAYSGTGSEIGGSTGDDNSVIVTGSGSTWLVGGTLNIGAGGLNNSLLISDGGYVKATTMEVSSTTGSSNATVVVTGKGSLWEVNTLNVGSNSAGSGAGGYVLVENGATLQVNTGLVAGRDTTGTISNRLSTFEFTTSSPTITTNGINTIIQTNGILSFKGVTAANINTSTLSGITYQGENTFQLNNSTGSFSTAYTFGTNNGANFQHFTMVNGGTRWQLTNTTLNTGGLWMFSNTTATVFGVVTNNAGTMKITATNGNSSTVTFEKVLVISGTGDGNGAIQNVRATNTVSGPITLMGNSTITSASGKLTVDGAITNGGHTLTVGGAGNVTLASQISGTGGLAINGGGTVILSNSSANTFSGATTITNSTVTLTKAGALGSTSGITLSSSGTLLLAGGAIDRIGNTSALTMAGGVVTLNDLSETMGAMTLTHDSTFTFNFNGSAGSMTFSSGSYTGGTLTIDGWFHANEGGEDKLYMTNDPGTNFLAHVTFTGWGTGGRWLPSTSEIVPSSVPEPGTFIASIVLGILASMRWAFKYRQK
jgi:fibronectin-binding autotransporter adhesin